MMPTVFAWLTIFLPIQQFWREWEFRNPAWLWLLPVPILLLMFKRIIQRSRWSLPPDSTPKAEGFWKRGWLRFLGLWLGWAIVLMGLTGPSRGRERAGIAVGRDVVIVLDLSRSMLAQDLTVPIPRWKAAVDAVQIWIDYLRENNQGHRVGVILFAARPLVLVPLTTDYDHLQYRLAELDGSVPPNEIRPQEDWEPSGTRIGTALEAAVELHDDRFPSAQDLILLTDGDDPVADQEWQRGVIAIRQAKLPLVILGLGNAAEDSTLFVDGNLLETIGNNGIPEPILTRLEDAKLQQLANSCQGQYINTEQQIPQLAPILKEQWQNQSVRQVEDDTTWQRADQAGYFFAIGGIILLFVESWYTRKSS